MRRSIFLAFMTVVPTTVVGAQTSAAKIDSGDTAWVLMCSALVLMMTAPGLALFYGGMVQKKNALTTIMHSFICMALGFCGSAGSASTREAH